MEMNGNVGKQTKQRKNKIKKERVRNFHWFIWLTKVLCGEKPEKPLITHYFNDEHFPVVLDLLYNWITHHIENMLVIWEKKQLKVKFCWSFDLKWYCL